MLGLVLLVFAFVFFVVEAFNLGDNRFGIKVGWLGLAFWVASIIFAGVGHLGR